jgi:signal transduction histidine kinase
VSLTDVAADVLEALPAAERERVAIATLCELPPAFADRNRIARALTNLVTNALKYSPPASPVSLEFAASEGEVVGSVRDRGIGIERENLRRVFDRFYRVGAPRSPAGLGLGLYITKLLVEAHGGRIWAESTTGEGSTFRFALPVAASDRRDAR